MNGASDYLENEWFVVRHSGEMPEVALHSSLYYLTEAEDGPGLILDETHVRELQQAAMARYQDIILRDLLPVNRDTSMYRGVKRAMINFQRYQRFCHRQGLILPAEFITEAADVLQLLLVTELDEVTSGSREATINCSFDELIRFSAELGIGQDILPAGLAAICPVADPTGEIAIV